MSSSIMAAAALRGGSCKTAILLPPPRAPFHEEDPGKSVRPEIRERRSPQWSPASTAPDSPPASDDRGHHRKRQSGYLGVNDLEGQSFPARRYPRASRAAIDSRR